MTETGKKWPPCLASNLPSLKLTAKAPENGWLEDDPFLFGGPIFRGKQLVLGRVSNYPPTP